MKTKNIAKKMSWGALKGILDELGISQKQQKEIINELESNIEISINNSISNINTNNIHINAQGVDKANSHIENKHSSEKIDENEIIKEIKFFFENELNEIVFHQELKTKNERIIFFKKFKEIMEGNWFLHFNLRNQTVSSDRVHQVMDKYFLVKFMKLEWIVERIEGIWKTNKINFPLKIRKIVKEELNDFEEKINNSFEIEY